MDIDSTIQQELAEILLKEVPQAQSFEGRDTLLVGIPNQAGWVRVRENHHTDIMKIIGYLQNVFLGEKEEEKSWELLRFIDNACRGVDGTATEKKLQDLRKRCVQNLQRAYPQMTHEIAIKRSRRKQVSSIKTTSPKMQPPPIPLPSYTPLTPPASPVTPNTFPSDFFMQAYTYVTAIQTGVDKAIEPFQDPFLEEASLTECRSAVEHLSMAIQQLEELNKLLEATCPLPEKIVPDRHKFMEKIEYLTEQLQILTEWIDDGDTKNRFIRDKFFIIEQELSEFAIFTNLKGADGSRDA